MLIKRFLKKKKKKKNRSYTSKRTKPTQISTAKIEDLQRDKRNVNKTFLLKKKIKKIRSYTSNFETDET